MAMLRKLVEESAEVAENIRAWVPAIDDAVAAHERAAESVVKGLFAVAPPTGGVILAPNGQPARASGSGGGSGGRSGTSGGGGGQGLARAGAGHMHDSAGVARWRSNDPSLPDPPGDYIGEVRGEWRWGYSMFGGEAWTRVGRALSAHSSGGGGGYSPGTGPRPQGGAHSAAYRDPRANYVQGGTGTVLIAGKAANDLAEMATGIRQLVAAQRNDNGAQLRRRGEL
jgi:hypothetical protein